MKELESGSFVSSQSATVKPETLRVVSWNVNRGLQLNGIVNFLAASSADLILLQEADINAYRTGRQNIPREIAQALRMNYIFGREFEELGQGSRADSAYHGQTTLSLLPLSNARILRFREQSAFWRPRWFVPSVRFAQRRLGGRMALMCEVAVGLKTLLLSNVHLESRGSDDLRIRQLLEIVKEIRQQPPDSPVLLAGDFNFEISRGIAASIVADAGMVNPFALLNGQPAALKNVQGKPAAIDWMLTRGILSASRPTIYDSISASDHFPLSVELRLR